MIMRNLTPEEKLSIAMDRVIAGLGLMPVDLMSLITTPYEEIAMRNDLKQPNPGGPAPGDVDEEEWNFWVNDEEDNEG